MTVILKVIPIQIGLYKGISKAPSWKRAYKKPYVGVRETKLGTRI